MGMYVGPNVEFLDALSSMTKEANRRYADGERTFRTEHGAYWAEWDVGLSRMSGEISPLMSGMGLRDMADEIKNGDTTP